MKDVYCPDDKDIDIDWGTKIIENNLEEPIISDKDLLGNTFESLGKNEDMFL